MTRNEEILQMHTNGVTMTEIAQKFAITKQRVSQIVKQKSRLRYPGQPRKGRSIFEALLFGKRVGGKEIEFRICDIQSFDDAMYVFDGIGEVPVLYNSIRIYFPEGLKSK